MQSRIHQYQYRNKIFAFITVIGSLVLSFGILEVGLRILGVDGRPLPPRQVEVLYNDEWQRIGEWGTSALKRYSPYPEVAMGEYIPNVTFRFVYFSPRDIFSQTQSRWKTNTVNNHINSYGLRGREVDLLPPLNTIRILLLGDSFTYGEGVEEEDTFSNKLEELLNTSTMKDMAGVRYETINAGVSGYNTHDEYIYLENRWMAFSPDLALIVFYLNDAYDDSKFYSLITGAGTGAFLENSDAFNSRSRVIEWLVNRFKRLKVARQVKNIYHTQFSDNPFIEGYDWNDSRRAFAQAAELTRKNGVRLGLVIFPELYELTEKYPFRQIHHRVREAAERLDIPVLDLLDTFLGEEPETLWVHATDHHPNARAHQMAAKEIMQFLKDPRYRFLDDIKQ